MNLEVEALIRELSKRLEGWPSEKTEEIHQTVSAAEIEKVILQLKSLQEALKNNLDEAQ